MFQLKVAATVGKGIVLPGVVDHHVVFGALIGAIFWNVVTWWYGIPSSSSHALIGGIVGAVIAKAGAGALIAAGVLKTVAFIFVSPLLGFLLGSLLMVVVAHALPARLAAAGGQLVPARCNWFRPGLYSLGHGGNDAQKTIGIIWMLLIATGYAAAERQAAAELGDLELLHRHRRWARCSAAGASSRPWASASPSSSRWAASAPRRAARSRCSWPRRLGIPVSTTHTITGAIVGVGSVRRASAVRWGVAGNIVWAWIFTIPASALRGRRVLLDQPALF